VLLLALLNLIKDWRAQMFNVKEFDIEKFDGILARGLSAGLGKQGSQVCIEAAVCEALGLPHGDDPGCVAASVRIFKIQLNDARWSSEKARAINLRDFGLAQLGSKEVVNDSEFMIRVAEKTIRILVPRIFKLVFPTNDACLIAAVRCAEEGTREAADAAADVATAVARAAKAAPFPASCAADAAADVAADAARAASYAANAARIASYAASYAANAARIASYAARVMAYSTPDEYLICSAKIGLDVLRELNSPGIALL
jgi:hypothetical protein